MNRIMMVTLLAVSLLVPAVARAHEGHSEKVMGTVSSVSGNNVMVKTTAGKTVMVMLDAKTKITRGKETIAASVLKVGDRVVAEGPLEKDMITATSLQVGGAATTKATAGAEGSDKAPAKPADAHAGHKP